MPLDQPQEIEFELPWLPPPEVRGNSRSHWSKKYRASKALRESGYAHGLEALDKGHSPMPKASITFVFRHWRRVDLDNFQIGMKGWVDGLVDSGILPDDNPDHLLYDGATFQKVKKNEEGVYVKLRGRDSRCTKRT
jgi:crossover junction endodeoxyribonuclease RusA